jgi:K+-sensing histidine kinase KdpD
MEPTRSSPDPAEPREETGILAALLESEGDLDALERGLLALAVHPSAGAADAAWLLRWDERRARLLGWRAAESAGVDAGAATAVARARRAPPGGSAASEAVRRWSATTQELHGACEAAWRTGEPAEGPGADQPEAPWSGFLRVTVLALRLGPRFHGLLVLARRTAAGEAATAGWLARAANAALATQVRVADARRRARHAAATAEFARGAVGAANVAEAGHALVRLAAQALQVPFVALYRPREDGTLALECAHGPSGVREPLARALQPAAAEVARAARALAGHGSAELPGPPAAGAGDVGVWTFQPLVAHERAHGVLAAWDGPERSPTSPDWERGDLELLATLADQAALLFEHARRLEDLSLAERRHQDLASRLREQDRVAAVGELASRVSEDARAPLASLTAFALRALHELPEEDPRREYLEAVRREAARLQALLEEQSAYAHLDRTRLRMEALNDIVHQALSAVRESLSRRRVRLVKKLAPDLPTLLLDAARIRRVIENIVAYALESLPVGGRLRVETRRAGAFVVIEVVHDRSRTDGDVLGQLFAPFGAGSASGAAVGLGVARQVVREHGGEIRVRTEDDWSNVFAVTLPVMENQDRRRRADRRTARGDRRRREPED